MTRALAVVAVAGALAAAPARARADATVAAVAPAPPRTTVSVELPALVARGVAVEVERDLPARRVSVAGGVHLRATAAGDYGSTTIGVGGEVRYWFTRRAIWSRAPAGAPVGWYVGGRLDLARTSVDHRGDDLGAQDAIALAVVGGYRFAPYRGLEVRPYTGFAVRTERDASGDLAAWSRGGVVLGFAVGWSW